MADLPANVNYGTVTGRLVAAVADTTTDVNALPDMLPISGTVTFTPKLTSGFAKNITQLLTIVPLPITCPLEASTGFLLDPTGARGVTMVATDDVDLQPVNWTYTVSFDVRQGTTAIALPSFSMALAAGTTIDLSAIVPVVPSTGEALGVAQAAAAAAATSAATAVANSGSGTGGLTTEQIQDMIAGFLTAGTGIQLTYDDVNNLLTIVNTGAPGTTDPEVVRDTIGAALVAGTGINIVVDDAGNTITISSTTVGRGVANGIASLDTNTHHILPELISGAVLALRYTSGAWHDAAGNIITARPTTRTDITFHAFAPTGTAVPSFLIDGIDIMDTF